MKGHRGAVIRGGLPRLLTSLAVVLVLAGGAGMPVAGAATSTPPLSVFAAASLTDAFGVLGKVLQSREPGLRVTFNFAGSQQLALQIAQGAKADVFASADQRWMTDVQRRGLVMGVPREFVRNRLVIIVPRSNPAKITRLQDLARTGIKFVIAADAVPAGRYAREALTKLGDAPEFGKDYAQKVLHNVVSEEENVRAVVTKVRLGEADAGAVYRSDVTATVSGSVQIIDIPDPYNVLAGYSIVRLKGAPNPEGADQFISLTVSPMGQHVLNGLNFIPVPQP
jgi:molybdate transport system substrate-binding protein